MNQVTLQHLTFPAFHVYKFQSCLPILVCIAYSHSAREHREYRVVDHAIICLCQYFCSFERQVLLSLVSALKVANLQMSHSPCSTSLGTPPDTSFLEDNCYQSLCLPLQGLCNTSRLCNPSEPISFNGSPLICIATASVLFLKRGRACVYFSVCLKLRKLFL